MQVSKRYLNEMAEMYGLQNELYTMERGVKEDGNMRYDITTIPPLIINGQYNKTKGHIHTTGHGELYIVLEGEAIFILQKDDEFITHHLKKGEELVIPGDCYHATINPSKTETLKMANWIDNACVSDYSFIEEKKGMKLYYTVNGWLHNENYA